MRLNPRNNQSGSDYINADFVKVKLICCQVLLQTLLKDLVETELH